MSAEIRDITHDVISWINTRKTRTGVMGFCGRTTFRGVGILIFTNGIGS
jgi:hypothetical protein